jgi:hypothetical protein
VNDTDNASRSSAVKSLVEIDCIAAL